MKLYVLFFILFCSYLKTNGQLTSQRKLVTGSNSINSIVVDLKDSGTVIATFNNPFRPFNITTFQLPDSLKPHSTIIRLNNNADTLWVKKILNFNFNDCIMNTQNELVMIGNLFTPLITGNFNLETRLLKFNLSGSLLLAKKFATYTISDNFNYYYYSKSNIIEFTPNRYIIKYSNNFQNIYALNIETRGYMFLKIDENFNVLKEKAVQLLDTYTGDFENLNVVLKNSNEIIYYKKNISTWFYYGSTRDNSFYAIDSNLNNLYYKKINDINTFVKSIMVNNDKIAIAGQLWSNKLIRNSFDTGLYASSFVTGFNEIYNNNSYYKVLNFAVNNKAKSIINAINCSFNDGNFYLYNSFANWFYNSGQSAIHDSLNKNYRERVIKVDSSLKIIWNKRIHIFGTADSGQFDNPYYSNYINVFPESNYITFKGKQINVFSNHSGYGFYDSLSFNNIKNDLGVSITTIDTSGNNALCNATTEEIISKIDSVEIINLPLFSTTISNVPLYTCEQIILNTPLKKITSNCLPLIKPKSKFKWYPYYSTPFNNIVCKDSKINIFESSYNEPKNWHWIFPPEVNKIDLDSLYLPDVRSISFNQAGVYPISLVTTNDAGSDTVTHYITVINFIPKPNLGNDTTLCFGDTLKIIYKDPLNSGHYFSGSGLYSISDTLLITTNGEYKIAAFTACGYLYDTINVKFASKPKANFVFNNTCNNLNVIFTNSSLLNFNPSLTYTYAYKPALAPANAYVNFAAIANTNFSFPSFDSFDVRLIVRSPLSCVQQDTLVKRIVLSPKPAAGFTYNNNCGSLNVAVINTAAIAAGSISSYQYFLNGVATSNSANFIYNAANYGSYNLQQVVTSSAGCVSDTFSLPIIVKAKPIVNVATLRDSICQNTNYTLTANATVDASTITNYTWLKNNMPIVNNTNTQTENNTTGIYTYKIVAQAATGCSSDTATKTITVASKPTVTINATNTCGSKQINITSTALVTNDNLNNYYLDFGDGNNNNNNPNNTTYTYVNFGNYTLKYVAIGSAGCQSDTAFFTIAVKDKPTATITYNNNACQNTNYTLIANATVNNSSITNYTWLKNNVFQANNTNTQTENNLANNYTYQLITTAANGCQSDTATQLVTVQKYPTVNFIASNGCANTPVIITNNSINNNTNNNIGLSYLWAANDGQTSTNILPNFSFVNAGTKNVTLKTSTINNCADSATKTITIEDKPIANFTINEACLGKILNLNNNSTGSITNFIWATNNGQSSMATTPNFIFNNAGSYTINLTASTLNNCTDTKTETLNIQAVQLFTTPVVDTNAVVNQPIQLNINGAATYTWQPATNLNNSNINNPIFNASTAGVYSYQIQGTTAQGCKGNATLKINVFAANNYLFIPNAFTPNSDGLNDHLRITCTGLQKLNYFTIYNRWGNMVYTQTNCNQNGWDGKLNGVLQPNATFVYNWSGVDFLGKKVSGKGTVTLIR